MDNEHTKAHELDDVEDATLDDMLMQIETLRTTVHVRSTALVDSAMTLDDNKH